ncbi:MULTISPECIES: sulfurtransferase [Microbacterium]|uniref:sulfurtransferase n=1 Tax=Microbacterium TaxID=33882 RepID=UPI00278178C9|nr:MULTISPECIES: sulfurtransferase [Microbacterium]MDQ1085113.1 thiosulfate/3-mercaptopyruvate sulfurtransferase [Microbacterium sp. SORGH_AS_0344]MDQ1169610.1 thiosulfate/3-mercaptopyruvate sulfurtransferase [Microbacterium proteolyticum]
MPEILTTPTDLRAALDAGSFPDGGPVRVLDVRWRLDRPDGRPEYLAGHIPGAQYVDLDHDLAEHGAPTDGRHPLPSIETLQAAARRWGIDAGDTVVVYDDLKNMSSARAWWLLRHAGVADVRLLDGSLRAWTSAGYDLETGDAETPAPGNVTLAYGALPVLELDAVSAFADEALLLDARAGERYRGEVEPIDPRAGHVPGAVSAPTTENVGADGRFHSPDQLRSRFRALGAEDGAPVGVYCGSGVTAAHQAVALTLAGFEARVFPGSWSQWSNHPELPVATGPEPR